MATKHDLVLDAIANKLYEYWNIGNAQEPWTEKEAKVHAQEILEIVEEYQSKSSPIRVEYDEITKALNYWDEL